LDEESDIDFIIREQGSIQGYNLKAKTPFPKVFIPNVLMSKHSSSIHYFCENPGPGSVLTLLIEYPSIFNYSSVLQGIRTEHERKSQKEEILIKRKEIREKKEKIQNENKQNKNKDKENVVDDDEEEDEDGLRNETKENEIEDQEEETEEAKSVREEKERKLKFIADRESMIALESPEEKSRRESIESFNEWIREENSIISSVFGDQTEKKQSKKNLILYLDTLKPSSVFPKNSLQQQDIDIVEQFLPEFQNSLQIIDRVLFARERSIRVEYSKVFEPFALKIIPVGSKLGSKCTEWSGPESLNEKRKKEKEKMKREKERKEKEKRKRKKKSKLKDSNKEDRKVSSPSSVAFEDDETSSFTPFEIEMEKILNEIEKQGKYAHKDEIEWYFYINLIREMKDSLIQTFPQPLLLHGNPNAINLIKCLLSWCGIQTNKSHEWTQIKDKINEEFLNRLIDLIVLTDPPASYSPSYAICLGESKNKISKFSENGNEFLFPSETSNGTDQNSKGDDDDIKSMDDPAVNFPLFVMYHLVRLGESIMKRKDKINKKRTKGTRERTTAKRGRGKGKREK